MLEICGYKREGWKSFKQTNLVGVVDNESTISEGRLARNAPRQLIVRGTW